jgi:hypothetical protein
MQSLKRAAYDSMGAYYNGFITFYMMRSKLYTVIANGIEVFQLGSLVFKMEGILTLRGGKWVLP